MYNHDGLTWRDDDIDQGLGQLRLEFPQGLLDIEGEHLGSLDPVYSAPWPVAGELAQVVLTNHDCN